MLLILGLLLLGAILLMTGIMKKNIIIKSVSIIPFLIAALYFLMFMHAFGNANNF